MALTRHIYAVVRSLVSGNELAGREWTNSTQVVLVSIGKAALTLAVEANGWDGLATKRTISLLFFSRQLFGNLFHQPGLKLGENIVHNACQGDAIQRRVLC